MPQDRSFDYIIKVTPPSTETVVRPAPIRKKITVIDKTNLKGQERRRVIARIFEEGKQALQDTNKIVITDWDEGEGRAEFTIQDESQHIEIKIEGKSSAEVHLVVPKKEVETTNEYVAARWSAFTTSCEKLWSEYQAGNVGLFWCIILPIWAIYDSWNALQEEALKPFLEEYTPSGPEGFLAVLDETTGILKEELSNDQKNVDFLTRLRAGIVNGKELLKVVDDPTRGENFRSEITQKITNSTKEAPVLLPVGYYGDKGYHTALLSIYQDGANYVVQKFSLGCEDPKHTGKVVPMLEYKVDAAKFPALLTNLIALQSKPKSFAVTPEEAKRLEAVGQVSEHAKPVQGVSDPLAPLLGNGVAPKDSPLMKPSDDPWKLLFTWIKASEPGLVEDKTQFMSLVTERSASHLLKYLDRLTLDQKEKSLVLLDTRLEKLESSLKKKDPELAKGIVEPVRKEVHTAAITSLQTKLDARDAAKKAALTEALPLTPLRLILSKSMAASTQLSDLEAAKEKDTLTNIYSEADKLKRLDEIFEASPTKEEADEAMKNFRDLLVTVLVLMKQQNYRKARTAAALTLSCLPSMDTPEIWRNFTREQMDELSSLLEEISGNFFEAKFRLGDSTLWPDELIHVWNAKAVMLSMMRERCSRLKKEAFEANGQTRSEEEWSQFFDTAGIKDVAAKLRELNIPMESAEDLCFRDFTLESAKICHLITNDPYLHFGEDPLLDKKAAALNQFFKDDSENRLPILFNAFEEKEARERFDKLTNTAVAPIKAAYEENFNTDEFAKQARTEIKRTEDLSKYTRPLFQDSEIKQPMDSSKQQYLPSALIDLRRHEVWSDALLNLKGTLYINFPSGFMGKARAASWFKDNYTKAKEVAEEQSEIISKIRDLNNADARRRLGEMGSLSIKIDMAVYDDDQPAVQIFSDSLKKGASEESSYGICFYRSLPPILKEYNLPEDPHLFRGVAGFMPEALAMSQIGDRTESDYNKKLEEKRRETNQITFLNSYADPYVSISQTPAESFLNAVESDVLTDLDPTDRYKVNSLKSKFDYFTSFNIWQLILNSPHLIDNPIVQNKILHLLFSHQALKQHLHVSPSEFISIAGHLDNQIKDSLEKGHFVRAGFLSFLSERLKQEIEEGKQVWQKIEDGDETALDQIHNWRMAVGFDTTYNKGNPQRANAREKIRNQARENIDAFNKISNKLPQESSVLKELLKCLNAPKADTDLKSLSLFILAGLNEDSLSILNAEETAAVLKAWQLIRSSEADISIPILRQTIVMKMEKTLLPLLATKMQDDKDFRRDLLNLWTGLSYPNWEVEKKNELGMHNPCKFFVKADGKMEATADIATCEVSGSMKSSARFAGLRFPIPNEIKEHKHYERVFGDERFSAKVTVSKDNPALQEYQFDSNGRKFTLIYDQKKKDLTIFQTLTQKNQEIRFRYSEAGCSEKTNIAKAIRHYGVWINERHNDQALFLPGKMQDWKNQRDLARDALEISLDKQGDVKSIVNSKGMYVIQDSTRIATPYFPFAEESDIIFFGNGEDNTIKQVRLLKEKMEFEVTPDGRLLSLDKPGWECWFYDTKQLALRFGSAYEQYMIPLKKGNSIELLLFPHAINPLRVRGETENLLDFDIKVPWDSSLSNLSVKIDEQGRLHGSHASFLYLAYVASAQGDQGRAAIFLEEASRADRTDLNEVDTIKWILTMFHEQPHPTAKTVAFQLKAEMTIRQILRDYYKVPEFDPTQWEAFSNEIERILTLHKEYESAINQPDKRSQLEGAKLLLSENEIAEFDRFRKESIRALLDIEEARTGIPAAEEITLKPIKHASPEFINYLILWMEPAITDATKDTFLKLGLSAAPENVLKHFWTYWQLISNKVITPEDLAPLMLPIRVEGKPDPGLLNAVDAARRLLLTYAHYIQNFPKLLEKKEQEIKRLEKEAKSKQADYTAAEKNLPETARTFLESKNEEIEELKGKSALLASAQRLEEKLAELQRIELTLSEALETIKPQEESVEPQVVSEEETKHLKTFGKILGLQGKEIESLKKDEEGLNTLLEKAKVAIQTTSDEIESLKAKTEKIGEPYEKIEEKLKRAQDLYNETYKLVAPVDELKKKAEDARIELASARNDFQVLNDIIEDSLYSQVFTPPKKEIFNKREHGINTAINYVMKPQSKHDTAYTAIFRDLDHLFGEMLNGATIGKNKTKLEGANKIVESRELAVSGIELIPPPTTKLSVKEFGESIDLADLPVEEKILYKAAVNKIGTGDDKEPVNNLLRKLLTEGKMPMVQLHRYNALKEAIAENDENPVAPTPFIETEIDLKLKKPSELKSFFTTDLRIPTENQLKRLANVFKEWPQYNDAWCNAYNNILNSQDLGFLMAEIAKEPVRISGSRDTAQFLLSAAAQLRLAEINAGTMQTTLEPLGTFTMSNLLERYEQHLKAEEIAFINQRLEEAKAPFMEVPSTTLDDLKLMVEHEYERFRLGLDEAAAKKIALIERKKGWICAYQIGDLVQKLKGDIGSIGKSLVEKQKEIFATFAPLAKGFGLGDVFTNPKFTDQEKMNAIIDLCEDGKLDDPLPSLVVSYLLAATEMQQKEKALEDTEKLSPLALKRHSLQKQLGEITDKQSSYWTSDEDKEALKLQFEQLEGQIKEIEIEWKELSSTIEDKIEAGENHARFSDGEYKKTILNVLEDKINQFVKEKEAVDRELTIGNEAKLNYLNEKSKELETLIKELQARQTKISDQNGPFIDQEQTLPYLVREYRQKLIFTTAQISKIEIILDDPNALEEFRMGLGKSSVIFPCVARILISRGKFPVILFTEELIEASRKDMDKRAYFFNFNRTTCTLPISMAGEMQTRNLAQDLAEEYHTLQTVKRSGRYIITTVERIAALENKVIELEKKLAEAWTIYEAQDADKKDEKLFEGMSQILEQLYWLKMISSLFDDQDTRIVADEIDEIFSIISEKNYSDGNLKVIDKVAFDCGERIFQHILTSSEPEIEAFRTALLNDKLSNYKKEEVQEAMQALAKEIYDDESFWDSISWQPNEKKPNREAFARYLSNIEEKELPGLPTWKQSIESDLGKQRAVAIGALRHWMTKTVPTLSEKQDGKDYGFAPDGYSVVPREEQREKPNTKFGQEAELIGYHFLAYIRNGKNPELDAFVISQIPEIQTRASKDATNPWRKWLKSLDPQGTNDPKTILASLQNSENYAERMQFLRFIMQDSPRIQVYHSQLTRNVQDTILGRKGSGASGTMSRFPLPEQFSYDRTKDARTGTGDTLLRLSLMGLGMDEKVSTFKNLLDQFKKLSLDPQCKAIINQGYATPNMTSRDVIAYLRNQEKKAILDGSLRPEDRRQYIFVDPITKQDYVWMPDAFSPQPFDKDLDAKKISPRHVLYYFGPADTRGKDFKIPYGYGALIVGPTTTPDKFDQAIWRLRALGQGQTCKIFAEESHAARFTPEGKQPRLKHLMTDLSLKGIQANATVNLKAASSRPEAMLRQEVKKAIFTPSGSSDRFLKAKSNPQAQEDLQKEIMGTAKSFKAAESLFVRSKELNFESDYTPSEMVGIIPFLEEKYEKMEEAVGSEDTQGILHNLPKPSHEQDLGTQRIDALRTSVCLAKSNLTEKRGKLKSDKDLTKFLQAKVSKSESGQKDAQAEVQEQQQQQQQQQTELPLKQTKRSEMELLSGASRGSASSFTVISSPNAILEVKAAQKQSEKMLGMPIEYFAYEMADDYPDCGLGTSYIIQQSFLMKEFTKVCPPNGRSIGYLIMYKHGHEESPSSWMSTWVTAADLETIRSWFASQPTLASNCLSFLSVPETADEPEIFFNLNPREGEKNYDELQLAIAKLTMGFSTYPEGEREKLFNWFTKELDERQRSNWIAQLEKKNAKNECIELLISWNKPGAQYVPAAKMVEEPIAQEPEAVVSAQPKEVKTKKSLRVTKKTAPVVEKELKPQKVTPDHYDVGGGGKCADYSMQNQLKQLGTNVSLKDLRNAAGSYLENNKEAIANDESWMEQIRTALRDAPDRPSKVTTSNIDTLDPKELITAYAGYIRRENTWWDSAAFLALAKNSKDIIPGMQIAVLQNVGKDKYKIAELYPANEKLNPDTCLFIWYNQARGYLGDHYHSFNRSSQNLQTSIEEYQKSFFANLMERLIEVRDPEQIRSDLKALSIQDPISYHAICYLIWLFDKPMEQDYVKYAEAQINQSGDIQLLFGQRGINQGIIEQEKNNFVIDNGQVRRVT